MGGTPLNEVNENLLLFPHSNVDKLKIATTGVVFLLDSNDGPREIACVDHPDDHAMSKSKGNQSEPRVSMGKGTPRGVHQESKCCLSTLLKNSQPSTLLMSSGWAVGYFRRNTQQQGFWHRYRHRNPLLMQDVSIVDFVEDILDRLIYYFRVVGSHRSLKNACTSTMQVNSNLEIFGLSKVILIEPESEVLVK
ncbi:hypothetical protein B9Z19DRAFT_1129378 [Tuber borchii]|uniref:Uncharacterized protein n=1 Tax=Tuber borchii TaxID=42251 RepID=A0A2T6ZMF9_TUBBO|nr:hypothetical protein B9Z19DRAFT_1129378 [Tuber borchii]